MQREIGSNFWISPSDLEVDAGTLSPLEFCCGGSDYVWLSTGRSAISFVLEEARRRRPDLGRVALIPPFTCDTVVKPFLDAGYTVRSYSVDIELSARREVLLREAEDNGVAIILIHRYFGFDTLSDNEEIIRALRERGVVTIEDRTQCLYSGFLPLPTDFFVASIRKWAGMPDGGFAVCREGFFSNKSLNPDIVLEKAKITAGIAKYRYLFENTGEKARFLKLYRDAEDILDRQEGYYAAARLSLRMQTALDNAVLKRKRRENYRALLAGLERCPGIHPLFSELPEEAVPLYFPLFVKEDRVALQAHLQAASIYAPVVWSRPEDLGPVCQEAEEFYKHLLCLPVDQRYDPDDMERIAERIRLAMGDETLVPDIYYLPAWKKLYAQRDGQSSGCFRFHHPNGTVIYPYVLRKTPDAGDGEVWYDIITPYGFNGPCVIGQKSEELTALLEAFEYSFDTYCHENHIIAEYVRFSPWMKNAEVFGSFYTLRSNGLTVTVDLTVEDILQDECRAKRRNQIRLAQKKGVVVEFDETGDTIDSFFALYQQTIGKNGIGAYYQFPLSFLKEHFQALKSHVCIANAKVNGQIISSSFLLRLGEHMHYHLSANDYKMTSYQGNSLLLYEAAKRGKAFGCKYFHLGGVGVAERSLLDFKLSFTRSSGTPFWVGSRVRNQDVFNRLTERYGKKETSFFPPYRG